MSELKVLHVIDKIDDNSGVSSVVMNYYKQLDDKSSWDFAVHEKIEKKYEKNILENGSHIYFFPELELKNIFKYIKFLDEFFKTHAEYDIIHGHISNAAVFYLGLAMRYNIKNRIIHSHSSRGANGIYRRFRNKILNGFVRFVATDYFACSKVASNFLYGKKFTRKKNVVIINNAIEKEKFFFNQHIQNEMREEFDLIGKYVVGHVGRFVDQKNHKFLIDVFYKFQMIEENSVLILIGDGILKERIEEKVSKLGISEKVIFLGVRSDVSKLMNVMDIILLPSKFEGLPVVGVEAQYNGLTCLFSDKITSDVKITKNVEFISLNDKEIWVNRMLYYKNLEVDRYEIIKTNDYDIKFQLKKLLSLYESISKEKKHE